MSEKWDGYDHKHLGTFNVYRSYDGALWVTVEEAAGVQKELGIAAGAVPLRAMAMRVLDEAVRQSKDRHSPLSKANATGVRE